MPRFGDTSKERLRTLHPNLRDLLQSVIRNTDCKILCGHRDRSEQALAVEQGHSKTPWPQSKHNHVPSLAVDVSPWPIPKDWGEQWPERVKFYQLAAVLQDHAARMGIGLRWGGDWDGDGDFADQTFNDLVHFELTMNPAGVFQ